MFDLKLCLLDLIRPSSNPKPKKSLKEMSTNYSSNFMQKYNDLNIIYFNENMSMTSRYDMRNYSPVYKQQIFRTSPMSSSFTMRQNTNREWGSESVSFEFSSDDREDKTESETDGAHTDAEDSAGAALDSFCTLCTSSFSFNQCRYCDDSACSSKCQSEKNIPNLCCRDQNAIR
ncbi:unnamed protein product [Hermetia illucens]|uniref:Uncharacterized protein n=1 Tax=Hermetia illucens TaxID=343691 RepID=A0A7R8V2B7_HERIL|nr:uncharacterized protein LOC119658184 [Hermetia illucens]CAD7091541.1 unnamed protein product [Hermetia illucens]